MSIASKANTINAEINNIKQAIVNKGQNPTTLSTFASAIGNISGGTTPTGTLSITANGVYDVTNYASADVSVSGNSEFEYRNFDVAGGEYTKIGVILTNMPIANAIREAVRLRPGQNITYTLACVLPINNSAEISACIESDIACISEFAERTTLTQDGVAISDNIVWNFNYSNYYRKSSPQHTMTINLLTSEVTVTANS